MNRHSRKRHIRGGFTLAEMLVVVAIIGILAAILVPVVFTALSRAKDARIVMEVANLDAAIRQYKATIHGQEYPPNFGNASVVTAHIQRKFGRYNPATATVQVPTGLDAAEALVFWLQGYGSNPRDPLVEPREALFDFDRTRLVPTRMAGTIQLYHYHPRDGQDVPYVYFRHDSYATASSQLPAKGTGTCRPYRIDNPPEPTKPFANAETFQIISAGQDGDWGGDAPGNAEDRRFPSGTGYGPGDRDNVTNFSEGTLGSKQ